MWTIYGFLAIRQNFSWGIFTGIQNKDLAIRKKNRIFKRASCIFG